MPPVQVLALNLSVALQDASSEVEENRKSEPN